MKFFKIAKRHLSKHTKARPVVRRSAIKKRILEQQEIQAYHRDVRREVAAERRADRVVNLGSSLIKALEWGYMRKRLRGKELEEQQKIAELWMEKRRLVQGGQNEKL